MYEESGLMAHKLRFSEDEAERIEQNAEEMGMTTSEYIKFAVRVFEQREEIKQVLDE